MSVMVNQDQEHLRLLAVFHYVLAGILAIFACFPLLYVLMGLFFVFAPAKMDPHSQPPPAFIGWIFVAFGLVFSFVGWALAIAMLVAGRSIAARRRLLFCQVIAGISCLFMPLGTVLGVFTLLVLLRPSVQQLFDANAA